MNSIRLMSLAAIGFTFVLSLQRVANARADMPPKSRPNVIPCSQLVNITPYVMDCKKLPPKHQKGCLAGVRCMNSCKVNENHKPVSMTWIPQGETLVQGTYEYVDYPADYCKECFIECGLDHYTIDPWEVDKAGNPIPKPPKSSFPPEPKPARR